MDELYRRNDRYNELSTDVAAKWSRGLIHEYQFPTAFANVHREMQRFAAADYLENEAKWDPYEKYRRRMRERMRQNLADALSIAEGRTLNEYHQNLETATGKWLKSQGNLPFEEHSRFAPMLGAVFAAGIFGFGATGAQAQEAVAPKSEAGKSLARAIARRNAGLPGGMTILGVTDLVAPATRLVQDPMDRVWGNSYKDWTAGLQHPTRASDKAVLLQTHGAEGLGIATAELGPNVRIHGPGPGEWSFQQAAGRKPRSWEVVSMPRFLHDLPENYELAVLAQCNPRAVMMQGEISVEKALAKSRAFGYGAGTQVTIHNLHNTIYIQDGKLSRLVPRTPGARSAPLATVVAPNSVGLSWSHPTPGRRAAAEMFVLSDSWTQQGTRLTGEGAILPSAQQATRAKQALRWAELELQGGLAPATAQVAAHVAPQAAPQFTSKVGARVAAAVGDVAPTASVAKYAPKFNLPTGGGGALDLLGLGAWGVMLRRRKKGVTPVSTPIAAGSDPLGPLGDLLPVETPGTFLSEVLAHQPAHPTQQRLSATVGSSVTQNFYQNLAHYPEAERSRIQNELLVYQGGNTPNPYLRKPGRFDAFAKAQYEAQLPWLDKATSHAILDQDTVVFRGIKSRTLAEQFHTLAPGAVLTDPAYLSTSFKEEVARDFISDGGEGFVQNHVLAEIHLPKGSRGALVGGFGSAHDAQAELLLPRNSSMEVVRAWEENGLRRVVLRPVSPSATPMGVVPVSTVTPSPPAFTRGTHGQLEMFGGGVTRRTPGVVPVTPRVPASPAQLALNFEAQAARVAAAVPVQGYPTLKQLARQISPTTPVYTSPLFNTLMGNPEYPTGLFLPVYEGSSLGMRRTHVKLTMGLGSQSPWDLTVAAHELSHAERMQQGAAFYGQDAFKQRTFATVAEEERLVNQRALQHLKGILSPEDYAFAERFTATAQQGYDDTLRLAQEYGVEHLPIRVAPFRVGNATQEFADKADLIESRSKSAVLQLVQDWKAAGRNAPAQLTAAQVAATASPAPSKGPVPAKPQPRAQPGPVAVSTAHAESTVGKVAPKTANIVEDVASSAASHGTSPSNVPSKGKLLGYGVLGVAALGTVALFAGRLGDTPPPRRPAPTPSTPSANIQTQVELRDQELPRSRADELVTSYVRNGFST